MPGGAGRDSGCGISFLFFGFDLQYWKVLSASDSDPPRRDVVGRISIRPGIFPTAGRLSTLTCCGRLLPSLEIPQVGEALFDDGLFVGGILERPAMRSFENLLRGVLTNGCEAVR